MNILITLIIVFFLAGCQIKVEKTGANSAYYDEKNKAIFLEALDLYEKEEYISADSLFTIVINNPGNKLSDTMPIDLNPYYYRGHIGLELDKYERVISDLGHVASDTTANADILLVRAEAFRMMKQYDTAIVLSSRLLASGFDSGTVLSLRGVCYYRKGVIDKACSDLKMSRGLGGDTAYLNRYLKDCK